MILVIDQRKGAMRDDASNLVGMSPEEFDVALSRAQSGTEPSAVIHIDPDGVFVVQGVAEVQVIAVKSEAELSADKARMHLAQREAERQESVPASDPVARLRRAFEGPSNSGHEEVKGV